MDLTLENKYITRCSLLNRDSYLLFTDRGCLSCLAKHCEALRSDTRSPPSLYIEVQDHRDMQGKRFTVWVDLQLCTESSSMHNFPNPSQPGFSNMSSQNICGPLGRTLMNTRSLFGATGPTDASGSLAHRIISALSLYMQNTSCACNMPVVLGTLMCTYVCIELLVTCACTVRAPCLGR